MDDARGYIGHRVHFDHHAGVIRQVTMSAAMQAYLAVPQGRLMPKWLQRPRPVPVYVWNADQDVCLAAFILEYHELLERQHNDPLLRWIVRFNNKIDVGGGLYPGDLGEVVRRLAAGEYRDVVEMTRRLPRFVPVIVWLGQADGGWNDLLEAGASGVLAEPYRSSEVRAVLEALPCLWARNPARECTPAGDR